MEKEDLNEEDWMPVKPHQVGKSTLADWVNRSYQTAELFWKLGIDYWAKGNEDLESVCKERDLVYEDLSRKLEAIVRESRVSFPDCSHWPLDLMVQYVEKVHHPFLYREFPRLTEEIQTLLDDQISEGEEEWTELKERFGLFSGEVSMHMRKEEMLVFPRIRKLCSPKEEDQLWSLHSLPSLPKLFSTLWKEHEEESEHLTRILDLIETLNAQAYGDRQVRIDQLEEDLQVLSRDFRFHTHLENNLLFPGVMEVFIQKRKAWEDKQHSKTPSEGEDVPQDTSTKAGEK